MNLKYPSVQDYDKCLMERTEKSPPPTPTAQQSFVREGPPPPRSEV